MAIIVENDGGRITTFVTLPDNGGECKGEYSVTSGSVLGATGAPDIDACAHLLWCPRVRARARPPCPYSARVAVAAYV